MKIQPLDFEEPPPPQPTKSDPSAKLVFRSRFKRLFERPFSGVLKISSPEKTDNCNRGDATEEFEANTASLSKMVQNFMEEEYHHQQRCGRNRCNCFNGKCTDSSDDEDNYYTSFLSEACEALKNLVPCFSASERNLLADVSHLVERNKMCKLKDETCRAGVVDGLIGVGYKASICRSKWEKSSSMSPPGVHEYIEVVIHGERLITDISFRAEFEMARSTKGYKFLLQMLPNIFVGKPDRLEKIIDIVSEAAKLSLKKKGMSLPPWRKADYMKAKWLSPSPYSNSSSKGKPLLTESGTKERLQSVGLDHGLLEFKPRILKTRNRAMVKVKTGLASMMEDQPQTSVEVLTDAP